MRGAAVGAAIQQLVNTTAAAETIRVLKQCRREFSSKKADAIFAAMHEVRRGQEHGLREVEKWRMLVADARVYGADTAVARQADRQAIETMLGHFSELARVAGSTEACRALLKLADPNKQPVTHALAASCLAEMLIRSEAKRLENVYEAIKQLRPAAIALRNAGLDLRYTHALMRLAEAEDIRAQLTGDSSHLGDSVTALFEVSSDLLSDGDGQLATIDAARDAATRGLSPTRDGDGRNPWGFSILSAAHFARYGLSGDMADLEAAVLNAHRALDATPAGSPRRAVLSHDLSICLTRRFDVSGDRQDIVDAVSAAEEAVRRTPADDPNRAIRSGVLGMALHSRSLVDADLAALERSLELIRGAVASSRARSEDWALWTANLGTGLCTRFTMAGDIADLETSIRNLTAALSVTPSDSPSRPLRLYNLGEALLRRYEMTAEEPDWQRAYEAYTECWAAVADDAPLGASSQHELGVLSRRAFEQTGNRALLDSAITFLRRAGQGSLADRERLRWATNLANCYVMQGVTDCDIASIDRAIAVLRASSTTLPHGTPEWARAQGDLAGAFAERALLTHDAEDHAAALAACKSTLEGYDADLWPEHILRESERLGRLYASINDWKRCAEAYGQALVALEVLYRRQVLRSGREAWLRRAVTTHNNAAFAYARAGHAEQAVVALERGRARATSDALALDAAEVSRLATTDGQLLGRFRAAAARLAALTPLNELGGDSRPGPSKTK
jgi:tetratricopeptide (TPR) repeat protein